MFARTVPRGRVCRGNPWEVILGYTIPVINLTRIERTFVLNSTRKCGVTFIMESDEAAVLIEH